MTRRLVVLMVGLVAATLVIAGLGTLVLANVRARADTESSLREQAFNTAANVALFFDGSDGSGTHRGPAAPAAAQPRRCCDGSSTSTGSPCSPCHPTARSTPTSCPRGVDETMLDLEAPAAGPPRQRPRRRSRPRCRAVRPARGPHRCHRPVAGGERGARPGRPLLRARRDRLGPARPAAPRSSSAAASPSPSAPHPQPRPASPPVSSTPASPPRRAGPATSSSSCPATSTRWPSRSSGRGRWSSSSCCR